MEHATGDTYTPEQRKTLEAGLRILARMIVREHLRRMAASDGEDDPSPTAPAHEDHSRQSES